MKDLKWFYKKFGVAFVILLLVVVLVCIMYDRQNNSDDQTEEILFETEQWEKGYDLPIDQDKKETAEKECLEVMEMITDVYKNADKGSSLNIVLSDEILEQMQDVVGACGYTVMTSDPYAAMTGYKKMDRFLNNCMNQKQGSVILYTILNSGEITRKEYHFDGSDMYLLTVGAGWDSSDDPIVSYISYARIDVWNYTERGWFGYELCVPEPPEVSEIIDGKESFRVVPLSERCRKLSKTCAASLGYCGNNILRSNWNIEDIGQVDYNGVFEFFYEMKYGKRFDFDEYDGGIPSDVFEGVIMEYLPVTSEQIQKWAAFDEKTNTYGWVSLGYKNFSHAYFETAIPEVVDVKEKEDGSFILTVEAVSQQEIPNSVLLRHELKLRFEDDGSFQYLGNEIVDEGVQKIPEYEYRKVN